MKAPLVMLIMMITGVASTADQRVFTPTLQDYRAVSALVRGKDTSHLTMPKAELRELKAKAKAGWRLEAFGVHTIGSLTLTDGFWFTKNHSLTGSFIIRIDKTRSGKRVARLEFPAG